MSLVQRNIERELRDILDISRVGALLGPRQSGKSTLALQLRDEGVVPHYYTLDDERLRQSAQSDPDGFVADIDRPAVIDEIQRAPDLLLAIKQIVDRNPRVPGQFLITGSANLLAARTVADALPGRIEYANLWPLAQAEVAGRSDSIIDRLFESDPPRLVDVPRGRSAYADLIVAGGFPEAMRRTARQRVRYFESYVRSVLGCDLPDIGEVRIDPSRVEQLLRLLAARTSGTLNYAGVAARIGASATAIHAHVELLAQLFLVLRLPPWSVNLGARQVKAPKAFVTDTGLASALIGIDARRYAAVDQGEIAGMLLETFVLMEIVKQRTWSDERVQLFFYRDQRQREVDIVLESNAGDVVGIETKSGATVDRRAIRGLEHLRDRLGSHFKAGAVIYCGANTVPLADRIWAIPLSGLWAEPGSTDDRG